MKTVISRIKPGVTWWELHNLAVQMLRDAGGYDKHYTYGIGHFIGMEVHDEGDYERPLQAGVALLRRPPDAEEPLLAWYREVQQEDWDTPAKVKAKYRSASIVGNNRVVFNIKGNDYRPVVKMNYPYRVVYIRFVGTHA